MKEIIDYGKEFDKLVEEYSSLEKSLVKTPFWVFFDILGIRSFVLDRKLKKFLGHYELERDYAIIACADCRDNPKEGKYYNFWRNEYISKKKFLETSSN